MIAIRVPTPLALRGSLFALALAVSPLVARAQDGAGKDERPAADKPAVEAPKDPAAPVREGPTSEPEALLARMAALFPQAVQEPAPLDRGAGDLVKARADRAKAKTAWEDAVRALVKAADEYLVAIGDSAPEPQALYHRGVAKILHARFQSLAEIHATYEAAAESLSRYLQVAGAKAPYRVDAEMHLGRALVFLAAKDPRRLDEALPHLKRAIELLQEDGRRDDAGRTAALALESLSGRPGHREFADAIRASTADFGASTPTVRKHAAAASTAVGAPFPRIEGPPGPDGTTALRDVDGRPLPLSPDGKPLLLHFFLTGFGNGEATKFRDVQTDIRPLWQRYGAKGLRVVGICMDWAIPKERAAEMRRQWDEWGHTKPFRDGSLESCREWAKAQGIEWPWHWDGLWLKNPVSLALGGVGGNAPHVVLVDGAGVIRWRGEHASAAGAGKRDADGQAYPGLADEVAKLLP